MHIETIHHVIVALFSAHCSFRIPIDALANRRPLIRGEAKNPSYE